MAKFSHIEKNKFRFWTNWLLYVNIITLFIGLLIAFCGNSFLFGFHNEGTKKIFFAQKEIPLQMLHFKNWLFGIIGATIAGFHLLIVFIVHFAFRHKIKWARNAIAFSILLWFFIDTGLSIYYEAYFNVYLINIPSLVLLTLPLLFTWKNFKVY